MAHRRFSPDAAPAGPAERIFRLGSVAYLNMQPLVYGLDSLYSPAELDLRLAPPSLLARWLAAGEIEMGMVPVAAIFTHPQWSIAGRSMIGSHGPVQSVLLLGGGPPARWRTLRPDSHSLTSNALAQVLLRKHLGLRLRVGEAIPERDWGPPAQPAPGEAFVLISSRALRWRKPWAERGGGVLDLGALWREWTGLPFVYALWAARPGAHLGAWPERLEALKALNRARLERIAQAWPGLADERLSPEEAGEYLATNIRYDFDAAARAGLERFYQEGRALDLFPPGWRFRPAKDK